MSWLTDQVAPRWPRSLRAPSSPGSHRHRAPLRRRARCSPGDLDDVRRANLALALGEQPRLAVRDIAPFVNFQVLFRFRGGLPVRGAERTPTFCPQLATKMGGSV